MHEGDKHLLDFDEDRLVFGSGATPDAEHTEAAPIELDYFFGPWDALTDHLQPVRKLNAYSSIRAATTRQIDNVITFTHC